jgi:hypothetical protein
LGQRSRKRRTTTGATAAATPAQRNSYPEDGVRRVPAGGESAAAGAPGAGNLERGYARARERDEEARASLEPLAPGERPTAVTVAAVVAALIGLGNVVLVITGSHDRPRVTGGLIFAAIMFVAAVFMWRRAYWAVLGFQALLGLSVITASLSLLVASNVEAVVRSVIVIAAAGTLFWFLIRAMARLQMPSRTR